VSVVVEDLVEAGVEVVGVDDRAPPVSAAILAMAAAVFFPNRLNDYSLESAHQTLTPLLGPLAGVAFAVALLASGLSSSTTATMAGQVIMEGFIHHKMNVWLRRASRAEQAERTRLYCLERVRNSSDFPDEG
jgi:NRAMP (natural resistance-associated macrophage protein)-like metal ion transporter